MTYMMRTMSFIISIFITYAPSKHVKHVTWHDLRKFSSKIYNSKINKSLCLLISVLINTVDLKFGNTMKKIIAQKKLYKS